MSEIELLKEINAKIGKLVVLFSIQGKDVNKQIVILRSRGLSYKEIGELLGIPEGTVKSIVHRKKKK